MTPKKPAKIDLTDIDVKLREKCYELALRNKPHESIVLNLEIHALEPITYDTIKEAKKIYKYISTGE